MATKGKARSEKWQILAICTGSSISLSSGTLSCWPSPSIPKLVDPTGPYRYKPEDCTYLAVIAILSVSIFSPFPGHLVEKFGRKATLLMTSALYISACLLNLTANNIYLFYLSRICSGAGDSSLYSAFPVYIAEITTPRIRGTWGNALTILNFVGIALFTVCGGYTSIKVTACFSLIFPAVFLATFPFMPESPYFYVIKGRVEEARKVLQKLRGSIDVEEELEVIRDEVNRQVSEPHGWKDMFLSPNYRKSTIAVVFLLVAQQTSGFTPFSVYTQYIFKQAAAHISDVNSAIIYNTAVLPTVLMGALIADKLGRKDALMISFFGAGVCLCIVSIYFFIDTHTGLDMTHVTFVPLLGMVLYITFWSFGIAIVPVLMLSELFSTSMQRKGLCLGNMVFGLTAYVSTAAFGVLDHDWGLYAPFAIFALCCFASVYLSYKFVPETKGKTIEEIQMDMMGANKDVVPDCKVSYPVTDADGHCFYLYDDYPQKYPAFQK